MPLAAKCCLSAPGHSLSRICTFGANPLEVSRSCSFVCALTISCCDLDLIGSASRSNHEVSYEFDDSFGDDSQYVYLEIRWMYGSSCENWSLKIWGDCNL